MQAEEKLYFVAIIPPEPLQSEAWALKELMHEQYGSKASLNSPAHITLHMPFKLKENREKAVIEALHQLAEGYNSFKVELLNFGAFAPRVIYLNVLPNDALHRLQADVQESLKRGFNIPNPDYNRPFRPHLTLASRDLSKEAFAEAWTNFKEKEFKAGWSCQGIHLLRHDGPKWHSLTMAHFANADFEEEEE